MTTILTIGGSPSHPSRSAALLDHCRARLEARGLTTDNITVRDLNADELIQGRFDGPSLKPAFAQVAAANGLIIATPVYKAAYTGVLKAFFDLLPANALGGKVVLPIALGGSLAHSLVIDYALRPVLSAMGASHILHGVYLIDKQLTYSTEGTGVEFASEEAEEQIKNALEAFYEQVVQAAGHSQQ
jgi:FMN reductase